MHKRRIIRNFAFANPDRRAPAFADSHYLLHAKHCIRKSVQDVRLLSQTRTICFMRNIAFANLYRRAPAFADLNNRRAPAFADKQVLKKTETVALIVKWI